MKNSFTALLALGLASCAAPKGKIIYEVPEGFYDKKEAIAQTPSTPVPKPAPADDDGMRLGDEILLLPDESQLRATAPEIPSKNEAAVIARPPKD